MEQRKVVVYETGDANQLQVENLSGEDVYIQSGEIVKGGKQDRVLKDDLILTKSSGKVDMTAFCVEQGRWSQRGDESVRAFASAHGVVASPAMKRAVKETATQGKVTGADVYATHDLFRKLWPKLLESAAVEAMAAAGKGERLADRKQLNRRTISAKSELKQGLVFETRDANAPDAPVHRSYVTK